MITEQMFRQVLKERFIEFNDLVNGDGHWEYICSYREYTLLRSKDRAGSYVIAWRAGYNTRNQVRWVQGHYYDGVTYDYVLKEFRIFMNKCKEE